jgi:hypothetical protein
MSSKDSPDTNRKLTASFSSPEFAEATNLNPTGNKTSQHSNNGLTVSFTSSNSSQTIKTFTATGIKLNSTRDSGFSDSIIEDSSITTTSSSVRTFYPPTHSSIPDEQSAAVARTEHILNVSNESSGNTDVTLSTKCFANKGK